MSERAGELLGRKIKTEVSGQTSEDGEHGMREFKEILVAGARPNFMKIAPIIRSLKLKAESSKSEVQSDLHPRGIRSAVTGVPVKQKKQRG